MGEIKLIKSSIFDDGLENGFFLRSGGVSNGGFSSLNFSLDAGDERINVIKNWEIAGSFVGWINKPYILNQIHSDKVFICNSSFKSGMKGDSLIIFERKSYAGVTTADCLPVVLFDPIKNVASIVHCGWKGTSSKIVYKTLTILKERFGCSFKNILATLYPCIGECCYEIKEDVAEKFQRAYLSKKDKKLYLNLKKANTGQLVEAGVTFDHIETIKSCTMCDSKSFYSYRRDGSFTGRHLTFIGLK